ncbi:MAG: glycosyltransferase family 2 protein [Proteobacteria bacterium]|nr:glycosyltransferase family 2 protein [Pseudomonadota bacterium]
MLSIVVPALNEADRIGPLLRHLHAVAPGADVVVSDGGSEDGTVAEASAGGAQVISGGPGRGLQMNAGAAAAVGDQLLFLHADTALPVGVAGLVERALEDSDVALGAFTLRFDQRSAGLALIEKGVRVRSRAARLPFGDQALFLRRAVFDALGGYRDQFMEDADLVRRARSHGRLAVLPDEVVTSARAWRERGLVRTTARNWYWTARFVVGG